MIEAPSRSVTRFFVPLIDVLILLFCIFLLMPFVSKDGPPADPSLADPMQGMNREELQQKLADAELETAALKAEVDRLKKAAANPADRMNVRVVEIEAADGRIYFFDADSPEPRQELRDQADAQRLIDQQRRVASGKEVFFLILYPRKRSGFPEQQQIEAYRRWFADVPHGFDNPWGAVKP